jgi:hypothetical protein
MAFLTVQTCALLLVVGVLLSGQRWKGARLLREQMLKQWKAALSIALIYLVAFLLGMGVTPGMFLAGVLGAVGMPPVAHVDDLYGAAKELFAAGNAPVALRRAVLVARAATRSANWE